MKKPWSAFLNWAAVICVCWTFCSLISDTLTCLMPSQVLLVLRNVLHSMWWAQFSGRITEWIPNEQSWQVPNSDELQASEIPNCPVEVSFILWNKQLSEIIMNGLYIYKCQRFYVHKTQLLFTIAIANAIAIANTNIPYTTERYTGIYTQKMVYRNTQ